MKLGKSGIDLAALIKAKVLQNAAEEEDKKKDKKGDDRVNLISEKAERSDDIKKNKGVSEIVKSVKD
jgi:hypothetical protein